MTTEAYNVWNIGVQITGAIISAAVGIIVWIYTRETQRLRRATDEQLTLAREQARNAKTPFLIPRLSDVFPGGLGFSNAPIKSVPPQFSTRIGNSSDQPAIYTHIVIKLANNYFLSRAAIEILAAGNQTLVSTWPAHGPVGPLELRSLVTAEYQKRLPEALFLELLSHDHSAISAVYMNAKGEMFLTSRKVTLTDNSTVNGAVSMLYP